MGIDVDGTRFAYREFGPSTGVPVVFLHHFTAVLDDWDPRVIDGVASERRVISFDNRGVGLPFHNQFHVGSAPASGHQPQ